MKAVLMSIRPEWCELIESGKKTVEIRKTIPRKFVHDRFYGGYLTEPFKVYIYETQGYSVTPQVFEDGTTIFRGRGKVIGEFVCGRIDGISKRGINDNFDYCYLSLNEFGNDDIEVEIRDIQKSCISKDVLNSYGANSPCLFAWHISDLVIYDNDKPKELNEFKQCHKCPYGYEECTRHEYSCNGAYNVQNPPQSWCYVYEV